MYCVCKGLSKDLQRAQVMSEQLNRDSMNKTANDKGWLIVQEEAMEKSVIRLSEIVYGGKSA